MAFSADIPRGGIERWRCAPATFPLMVALLAPPSEVELGPEAFPEKNGGSAALYMLNRSGYQFTAILPPLDKPTPDITRKHHRRPFFTRAAWSKTDNSQMTIVEHGRFQASSSDLASSVANSALVPLVTSGPRASFAKNLQMQQQREEQLQDGRIEGAYDVEMLKASRRVAHRQKTMQPRYCSLYNDLIM
jgi:hypothetical protein